jgi:L,D-peptidoglycan transpeptidase YkuD (ErfK/YbiS/YcfS/YnhG family)
MTMLTVDSAASTLSAFGEVHRTALGKGGVVKADQKREGDGATPLGRWALHGILLRPDRIAPLPLNLPWRWLRPSDGWADDPADPAYNRPVSHPHPSSAERLWREDHAYDVIVVLGHNCGPVIPGLGSAIFWHLAQPDWRATEGCVAITAQAMLSLLPRLVPGMALEIR